MGVLVCTEITVVESHGREPRSRFPHERQESQAFLRAEVLVGSTWWGTSSLGAPGVPQLMAALPGQRVSHRITLGFPQLLLGVTCELSMPGSGKPRFCQPCMPCMQHGGTVRVAGCGGREGSPLESPATFPGRVGMVSRDGFSTEAPEKEPLPTCTKPCVHQALPHAHVSPLGHFSLLKGDQGSPAVHALLLSPVTTPAGLACQEDLFVGCR